MCLSNSTSKLLEVLPPTRPRSGGGVQQCKGLGECWSSWREAVGWVPGWWEGAKSCRQEVDGFDGFGVYESELFTPKKPFMKLIFFSYSKHYFSGLRKIKLHKQQHLFQFSMPQTSNFGWMKGEAFSHRPWLSGPGSIGHFCGQGPGCHWWKPEGFPVFFQWCRFVFFLIFGRGKPNRNHPWISGKKKHPWISGK